VTTRHVDEAELESLRLCIYESFAATGALPSAARLAEIAGSAARLADALDILVARKHVVRDAEGALAMAHPFASRSFGFSVMSADTLWWGGCAWDAFAIPHVVAAASDVLVATRCPACDRALAWVVGRTAPPAGPEVAHFAVPVDRMWIDVIHTCSNQRLYCSDACIDRAGLAEGSRLDLTTLWKLAAHWYDGRLSRGYMRRSPEAARAYFRSVGLDTPFWQG
jgi:hypothetical protein